jgi:hypothetical protein
MYLTTPPLFRDAVVTVSIAEWDLTCNLFDGETALGPVPRLFATNPEEALAALNSDEARAFRDLQRIMAKFLVPENIPPHKAWDFLNNVRYKYRFTITYVRPQQSVLNPFPPSMMLLHGSQLAFSEITSSSTISGVQILSLTLP